MPRVLMLGPSIDAQGGMATVERNIIEAVKRSGDSIDFLSTFQDGGKPKKLVIAAGAYARYLMCVGRFDLVHVHMASRGSFERKKVFMRTAFRRGIPVLLHLHGSEFGVYFDECTDSKRDEIRDVFGRCSGVIVLSEEWRDFVVANRLCEESNVRVLHNAVVVPAENLTDYSNRRILFMGRLNDRKSPDILLRAAKEVLRDFPDTSFSFGGDGDVNRYRRLASELGISDRCNFLGWLSGAERESNFRKASVYCLPSRNEGMPMSVLEAMSYGLATVTTPVGGIPQVIEDRTNGLLVPVGDYEALATVLKGLLADEPFKRRLGEAGRATIESRFGMKSFIEQLMAIYDSTMAENSNKKVYTRDLFKRD